MDLNRICILLLLTAVAAASAGCTGSPGTPATTVPTPETITPLKTTATLITRLPASEVARITVDHFGWDPSNADVYEFIGKVQVDDGPYSSVKVILRYPDTQEYVYNAGGMGGSNPTIKPFYLYPDGRYEGTNPEKIIELDGKRYATTYRYDNGVLAWEAMRTNLINQ